MKKVVLSLAFVASLAVVSCKDANAEAPVEETPVVEVVEEAVVETVDSAAVAVDSVVEVATEVVAQ